VRAQTWGTAVNSRKWRKGQMWAKQMNSWQPIETAPRDGSRVLCWAPGWQPCLLIWKLNNRIQYAHSQKAMLDHAIEYFGDYDEWDDYDLALSGNGPTHWLPLPEPPKP
jgi:hypothetical protein